MRSIINKFKVRQLGMKSKYDKRSEGIRHQIEEQDETRTKLECKNKLLKLEKDRLLKFLDTQQTKFKNFNCKDVLEIINVS